MPLYDAKGNPIGPKPEEQGATPSQEPEPVEQTRAQKHQGRTKKDKKDKKPKEATEYKILNVKTILDDDNKVLGVYFFFDDGNCYVPITDHNGLANVANYLTAAVLVMRKQEQEGKSKIFLSNTVIPKDILSHPPSLN